MTTGTTLYELIDEASNVLRTPPADFDFDNPLEDPKDIEKNLSEVMDKFGGLGLSANQVGLNARVFVMRTADKGTVAFFNPELTKVSQETELLKEGCLSFPDIYLMIKRSKQVEMKYCDSDGEVHVIMLEGLGARCVQHEIDHLNGIIFLQRASQLKIERALKARPKERQKRIEYEKRQALAKYIQKTVETDTDSEHDNGTGIAEANLVPQNAQAS
jgi:peptide deformylase